MKLFSAILLLLATVRESTACKEEYDSFVASSVELSAAISSYKNAYTLILANPEPFCDEESNRDLTCTFPPVESAAVRAACEDANGFLREWTPRLACGDGKYSADLDLPDFVDCLPSSGFCNGDYSPPPDEEFG